MIGMLSPRGWQSQLDRQRMDEILTISLNTCTAGLQQRAGRLGR
jgi:hypothetical protein